MDHIIALAYMEEHEIDLDTLIVGISTKMAQEDPSRMKEIIEFHSSLMRSMLELKEEEIKQIVLVERYMGSHPLIIPSVDISPLTKKQREDIRLAPEVYEKHKEAIRRYEKRFGWERNPLKVISQRHECIMCNVYYNIVLGCREAFFSQQPDICYYCTEAFLCAARGQAKFEMGRENVQTIREALRVLKVSSEVEEGEVGSKRKRTQGTQGTQEEEGKD